MVCGAVLRGIEGSITTEKKCRRHYGYMSARPYDPNVHKYDKSQRYVWYDIFQRRDYLSGFMKWKVAKVCRPQASNFS